MKQITISLNEEEYDNFNKLAKKFSLTDYALAKEAILTLIQPQQALNVLKLKALLKEAFKEAYEILDQAP